MPAISAIVVTGTSVSRRPAAPMSQLLALGYLERWTRTDGFLGTWVMQASVLEAFDASFPKRYLRRSVKRIAGHLTDRRG